MKEIETYSLIVTEKCNLSCTYCHFFEHHDRSNGRDLSTELITAFAEFIKYRRQLNPLTTYRFSGGDPLAMGDALFDAARICSEIIGTGPYILTGGHGITSEFLDKCKSAGISRLLVSLENPLNSDPGAEDPFKVMKAIRELSSLELPIELGATIVGNEDYGALCQAADIVFGEIGQIPKFQEKNYWAYESPSDQQLEALGTDIHKIVRTYHGKARFDLFCYVSPELSSCHGTLKASLYEFNRHDDYGIAAGDWQAANQRLIERRRCNYPDYSCPHKDCDWHAHCGQVKWLWTVPSTNCSADQKRLDYCRYKKTINEAFFEALKDKIHA